MGILLYPQENSIGGYFMRYTDLTKSQNKKILSLLEREDKRAGSPSNKPVVQGNASAGIGAAAPETAKPSVTAKGIVSGSVGAGLTKAQQKEAALVGKLPGDFPIEQWESMNTKAQLKAMQHSGLTDQEQWVLLNATAPLSVLDEHNQMRDEIAIKAYVTRILTPVSSAAMTQSGQRTQTTDNKPTISPSLQRDALRQELYMLKEEGKKNPLGKAVGGVGAAAAPTATGNITASVGSTLTPLPKPGPMPVVTPGVDNKTSPFGKSAPIDFSTRDKQVLLSMLNMDRSLLSVSDRKAVEFIERQIQRGVTTPGQLGRFYDDLFSIRAKVTELEWVDDRKKESKGSATWGTEMINNQSDYSSKPGSFGKEGNMKDNACGYMAINNANQVLGDKTDFGNTSYTLNSDREFTTLLGGTLGMNPLVVGSYYRSKGYRVNLFLNPSNVPKTSDAYIMLYFYKDQDIDRNEGIGGHYIAVTYNPSTDKFTAYNNQYGKSQEEDSLDKFLPTDPYGYCVWGIEDPDKPQSIGSAATAYEERY